MEPHALWEYRDPWVATTEPRPPDQEHARRGAVPDCGESLEFGCKEDCLGAATGEPIAGGIIGAGDPQGEEVDNADTTSNLDGNITVVAIAPDFTAGSVTDRAMTAGYLFNNKLANVLRAMGY